MSEIVGRELKRWAEKLEALSEYDITIVNILLKNYETLIDVGGTAGGKRANKIAEYIYEKKAKCDTSLETLTFGSTTNVKKIKRIKFLKVDSFRGFSVSREFNLEKSQYSLMRFETV